MKMMRFLTTHCLALLALSYSATAAELKPEAVAAFDRYVKATEARMKTEVSGDAPLLWLDRLAEDKRADVLAKLELGEVVIERLETRDGGGEIDIPSGMVHHWVGTVLLPGVTVEQTIAMVKDYGRYPDIYAPEVTASEVREQDGNRYHVYLRLYTKKIVTWVANTEHDVEYMHLDEKRVHVPSRSTRILEIEHPDSPREREKPEGNDRGFAWRLNNYCSFEERSDDTIMQCESITLTRGIPFLLGMIVRPFVTSVPKDKLTFTLEAARRHLAGE